MTATIGYNAKKLEELILYVAMKMEGNDTFGRTKLVKVLFFSDFLAFARLGAPITGATYRKHNFGPCPTTFPEIERRLHEKNRAFERIVPSGPFQQRRLVAKTAPDLTVFSAEEIAIVDSVIERLRDASAAGVSELSHQFAGWRLVAMGEEIPYFTVALPNQPIELSPEEEDWARAEARRLLG